MIKHFCDKCGKQMTDSDLPQILRSPIYVGVGLGCGMMLGPPTKEACSKECARAIFEDMMKELD